MGAICHDYKNQHISLNEFCKLNNPVKKVIVQRLYHKVIFLCDLATARILNML